MRMYGKKASFAILLAILTGFCGKTEGAKVTCELEYGFLPCTSGLWGRLFLIVVYQYLMSIGQSYISNGSDKFFILFGPGIFGASLFHIHANFPTLYIVLESRLSCDVTGASASAAVGMSVLAGSAVMNLTLIWPSVVVFGSYDLAEDDATLLPQLPKEEPSFLTKLTAYGVTTDRETSYTARLMLVSMIPFLILQLPEFIPSLFIPYFVIPCAIGIPRLLSTITSARQRTQRAASLTLSQIYSGMFMSNMSGLSTFLLTVYIKDIPWDAYAEVLVVFIICVVMGIYTSTRTIFPLWTGFVGYLFYPISILMLYLLTVVWGWS